MSIATEEQYAEKFQSDSRSESDSIKKSKISYTRDFLLSLAELDICKKLPRMFDRSFLSELEDIPEPTIRKSFNFSSQCVTQEDHDSSLSIGGDARNYSCHTNGACDNASTVRNDQDGILQHDIYSDSEICYVDQTRQHWKSFEHEGLLGNGSFPRPYGFPIDNCQFTRTLLPSDAPFPYKALPQHHRSVNDSYNNETFGSSDCHSCNRSEEERKRKASFELMRKESRERMVLDKVISEGNKDVVDKGIGIPMSSSALPNNGGVGASCLPQSSSISRPPVPPGFLATGAEKCLSGRSTTQHYPTECGSELQNNGLNANGNSVVNLSEFSKGPVQGINSSAQHLGSCTSNATGPCILVQMGANPCESSSKQSDHIDDVIEHHRAEDMLMNIEGGESSPPPHSTSLLNKIFAAGLMLNDSDSSSFIKDVKEDETWILQTVQSSKFAPWFHEDEKKEETHDPPSSKSDDLLSLIGGFRDYEPCDLKIHKSSGLADDHHQTSDNAGCGLKVLTCEDVEQSILSEIGAKPIISLQPPEQPWIEEFDTKADQWETDACDKASQHLLSLLHGGTGPTHEEARGGARPASPVAEPDEKQVIDDGKNLTLETLFGTAFMNQLQSAASPATCAKLALPDEDCLLKVGGPMKMTPTASANNEKAGSWDSLEFGHGPDTRVAIGQPPSLSPFTFHHHLNHLDPMVGCPPDLVPHNNNTSLRLLAAEYHFLYGDAPNFHLPWRHHLGAASEPPGFDMACRRSMLEQMHLLGNFPQLQPQGHAGGDVGASYRNYYVMGGAQYPNSMQGYAHGGDLPPNFGYCGNLMQGSDMGRMDGMAFQRMMELQLRAKQ